jgi:hypothetical protein
MKNLLNIDDQVKIIMPGTMGDGATAKATQIGTIDGEIYYTGIYHYNCPKGGDGYDTYIQFKEGQYEPSNTVETQPKVLCNSNLTVRCKFKCVGKEDNTDGSTVTLEPVTYGSKENEDFFNYTPYGSFYFGTINKEASKQFEVNKEYYIDLTPAE